MNVNQVAFLTTTTLAGVTVAATMAAASATAGTVAMVAYAVLAITAAGTSIASITAWVHTDPFDRDSNDIGEYFKKLTQHAGIALAGFYQFTAQTLMQALIRGIGEGVSTNLRRRIAGPDFTYSQV